jgi:hypothetical protein
VLLVVILYWKKTDIRWNYINIPSLTEDFVVTTTPLSGADMAQAGVNTSVNDTVIDYGTINTNVTPTVIVPTSNHIEYRSAGSRECAIYNIDTSATDMQSVCDSGYFNLSTYLLKKYRDTTTVPQNSITGISINATRANTVLGLRQQGSNSCKISFRDWSMPTMRNNLAYSIVDSVSRTKDSIGTTWPQCYKLSTDANATTDAISLRNSLGSSIVAPTTGARTPYSDNNKYAEVTFLTANVSDISNTMLCSIAMQPVITSSMQFLKITVNPYDNITDISFVRYNPTSNLHLTKITDESSITQIKRRMYVYRADNRSLIMRPMIYSDSRIYQFEVDTCQRVSKVSILPTTSSCASSTCEFSLSLHLGFSGGINSKRIAYNTDTSSIINMANQLNNGNFTTTGGVVTTACIQSISTNINYDFNNITNKSLQTAFNKYGASSDLNNLMTNENGEFYIALGNNLVPTQNDIDRTIQEYPAILITNGVTSCIGYTDATDRDYLNADMLARDSCAAQSYKGWSTLSDSGCTNGLKKYTCAYAFTVTNSSTEPITEDAALRRNYSSAYDAAKTVCSDAKYTSANGTQMNYYSDAVTTKPNNVYECMKDPNDIYSYIGQYIQGPNNVNPIRTTDGKYYVTANGKLQGYTAEGADYYAAQGRTFTPINSTFTSSLFPSSSTSYETTRIDIPPEASLENYIFNRYLDGLNSTPPVYNLMFKITGQTTVYIFILVNNANRKIPLSQSTIDFYTTLGFRTVDLPAYYTTKLASMSGTRTFDISAITGVYQLPWGDNNLITLSVNYTPTAMTNETTKFTCGTFTYGSWFTRPLYVIFSTNINSSGIDRLIPLRRADLGDNYTSQNMAVYDLLNFDTAGFNMYMQENSSTITRFVWEYEEERFRVKYLNNDYTRNTSRWNFPDSWGQSSSYLTKFTITRSAMFANPLISNSSTNANQNTRRVYKVPSDYNKSTYTYYRLVNDSSAEKVSEASVTLFGTQLTIVEVPFYYDTPFKNMWNNDVHDVNDINGTYTNTYFNNNRNVKYPPGTITGFNPSVGTGRPNGQINNGYNTFSMDISHIGFPHLDIHFLGLNNLAGHWNYKTGAIRWNNCSTWSKTSSTDRNGDAIPGNCWQY